MKNVIHSFVLFICFGINTVLADNICIQDFKNNGKIELEEIIYLIKGLTDSYQEQTEKTFTNSVGMTFVYIEPGTFMMGNPSIVASGPHSDEIQHHVTLTNGFYLQTTEVTQGQWNAVMGNNPSYFSRCGNDCPVEQVSWNDAQNFIQKLNQKEDYTYRLPTEAEWEYAARAGSTTDLANGDINETGCSNIDQNMNAIGWYCGNANDKTNSVAQKQANIWGLFDMHGNVWEWCQDWYDKYSENPLTDPMGPTFGSYRVIRGGSFVNSAPYCRSMKRDINTPDNRLSHVGFRLLRIQ